MYIGSENSSGEFEEETGSIIALVDARIKAISSERRTPVESLVLS